MDDELKVLGASAAGLAALRKGLDDGQLEAPSYCSEWTIADVLSHIGSGAVIMKRGLGDVLSGTETPSDFNQSVWDEWNAKSARAQADDALVADQALVEALESVPEGDRAALAFPMGPMQLPFAQFVRMRLNEHVLHTWDIGVMGDPTAQLPVPAAAAIVDGLGLIASFAGKPTGEERTVAVHTTEPERDFTVSIGAEAVALTEGASGRPEITLPAEALVRLVYGRLDPEHTPPISGDTEALEALRRAFPGF